MSATGTILLAQNIQPEGENPTILSSEAPSLRFENLGMADGLAQKSVQDIYQDSLGYIWMATQGGLHRYNGYEFEIFQTTPFDSTSISSNFIFQIEESTDGDLWVTTADGLNRYDRETGTFTTYIHDPQDSTSLSDNMTRALLEDSQGDLWVGTENSGLNRMSADDQKGFKRYQYDPDDPQSISSNTILGLSEDELGNIWVGTLNGLNKIDPQTGKVTRYIYDPDLQSSASLSPHFIRDVYPSPNNPEVVWAASGQGLIRLNHATGNYQRFYIKPVANGQKLSANLFFDIESDPNNPGVLWVAGSSKGLARFSISRKEFTLYSHKSGDPNSIAQNATDNIFTDRTGKMWVGHFSSGVSSFNPNSMDFTHFRHESNNPNSMMPGVVWGMHEDKNQKLWAVSGTEQGTVTSLDLQTGSIEHYKYEANNPQSLLSGRAATITGTQDGSIWVGSFSGLNKLNKQTSRITRIQHKPIDQNTDRNFIYKVYPSADKQYVWIGNAAGIDRYHIETGTFTPIEFDNLETPSVLTFNIDSQNRVWAGSESGLLRVYPDNHAELVAAYNPKDTTSISDNFVVDIHQRKSEPDVLWLGTFGGGLNRYEISSGTAKHYTKADGLPSNAIYGILEDEKGTLWMSTNRGISNFDPETETFRNYGLSAGLRSLEYSQNGFEKGSNGVLYFGSDEGITAFRPNELSTNTIPPQVVISDFRIYNEAVIPGPDAPLQTNIEEADQITIDHNQSEITFEYVALHYANPEKNSYAYKLEGFDKEWVQAGTKRSVDYTNLEPGSYTFHVKAANADEVWNEKGASVQLTVLPPWYQTWWAYGLFTLIIGGIAFGIERIQRRRLTKKERERAKLREAKLRAEEENKRRTDTEKLSKIGRTITSTLSVNKIINTVYQNVNELMDATIFGVGIYDEDQNHLLFPATKEKGGMLPSYVHNLDDSNRLSVRCFKNQEEIIIDNYEQEYKKYVDNFIPAVEGEDAQSIIYLPLVQQDKTIGVITIQSFEKDAYSEYHVNLFRNLATYAAIALDNASAYRQLNNTLEELKDAQTQLVQQEKLASLGQLTAGIAHEIKNPLNFVNNFSDLSVELVEEARAELSASNDEHSEEVLDILKNVEMNLKKIHEHGSRADGIVKSMLQHSRGGDGKMEPTNLNGLVEEYVNLAFHGMRASENPINVDIQLDLNENVGQVPLIAEDFSRVIINLCGNAFDAMRKKTHSNEAADDYQPKLTVRTKRKNGQVMIEVEDNGPGIPAEVKGDILQPFFTTKEGKEGTGLGLSITHDIVKAHGGELQVESTIDKYTCFTIKLDTNGE